MLVCNMQSGCTTDEGRLEGLQGPPTWLRTRSRVMSTPSSSRNLLMVAPDLPMRKGTDSAGRLRRRVRPSSSSPSSAWPRTHTHTDEKGRSQSWPEERR